MLHSIKRYGWAFVSNGEYDGLQMFDARVHDVILEASVEDEAIKTIAVHDCCRKDGQSHKS